MKYILNKLWQILLLLLVALVEVKLMQIFIPIELTMIVGVLLGCITTMVFITYFDWFG